jgi:hypothetical protein
MRNFLDSMVVDAENDFFAYIYLIFVVLFCTFAASGLQVTLLLATSVGLILASFQGI